MPHREFNRRQFIQTTGSLGALRICRSAPIEISIIVDPADAIANTGPALWAIEELEGSLTARGINVRRYNRLSLSPADAFCIVAASAAPSAAILKNAGVSTPSTAESLAIVSAQLAGRNILLACGYDTLGLVYAALELADRVQHARDPVAALQGSSVEQPANRVRGIATPLQQRARRQALVLRLTARCGPAI